MSTGEISPPQLEQKKDSTDEFILLGILSLAYKKGLELERLQIMKILRNFKAKAQECFKFEAYHKEFVREKHGDFTSCFYDQMSNLKKADFITSTGEPPYEKFSTTQRGDEVFERIRLNSGADNLKLKKVRGLLERIINEDASKSSEELRKENHERMVNYQGRDMPLEEIPVGKGIVTTPNLDNDNYFIFDDGTALDWMLYRKIAKRNREELLPDEEIPQNQKEAFSLLGL